MNNRNYLSIMALLFAGTGCASERLYVKVVDDEGAPVSNATVSVYFSSSHVILAKVRPGIMMLRPIQMAMR